MTFKTGIFRINIVTICNLLLDAKLGNLVHTMLFAMRQISTHYIICNETDKYTLFYV